jgi:hypothetical protein
MARALRPGAAIAAPEMHEPNKRMLMSKYRRRY